MNGFDLTDSRPSIGLKLKGTGDFLPSSKRGFKRTPLSALSLGLRHGLRGLILGWFIIGIVSKIRSFARNEIDAHLRLWGLLLLLFSKVKLFEVFGQKRIFEHFEGFSRIST